MGILNPDPKHDFTTKLRQPSLLPRVLDYIKWQRMVRAARAEGRIPLEAPDWLMPLSINLDLTTACNFRCSHCIDLDILNSKEKYSNEQLISSLKNMINRGLRSVILIGGGEPTLYPEFGNVVRFLKKHGVQIAIASNGSRNRIIYDIADCLAERDWVRLSLDSGSNDTFVRMHKPPKNITLEEICSWVPLIRKRNPKLSVGFSFVIMWKVAQGKGHTNIIPNINEIIIATKLARDYHFNYISFKPFLTRYPDGAEVMNPSAITDFNRTISHIQQAINKAKAYETEDFKVVKSTNLMVLEQKAGRDFTRQPSMCHMQTLRQVLSPLGLFNCPACRGMKQARISGKDAYSEPDKIRATQKFVAVILDRFDTSRHCANVTCLYNSANWWIEKAIRGELDPKDLKALEERFDYFL